MKEIKGDTIQYLQMLQESISRMSTASAIFKGFSATVVSGIALTPAKGANLWMIALSFLPVIIFCALDVYYLRIERINRYWFEQVRLGNRPVDFRLNFKPKEDGIDPKVATIRPIRDCMRSVSIWLFYPPMVVVLIITLIIKSREAV